MSTRHKLLQAIDASVEAEGDFTALVAAYNVDRAKDRIVPGAFAKSLDAWRASGKRIPILWAHATGDPSLVVGSADPMTSRETSEGLVLKGKLNVYTSSTASHVRDLLLNGDVDSWSFGYSVIKSRKVAGGVVELQELDLHEASVVVAGANPAARTLSVKGQDFSEDAPSHIQVERRLIEAGIIPGPVMPSNVDDDEVRRGEEQAMRYALGHRGNGDEQREAKSVAPIVVKEWSTAA